MWRYNDEMDYKFEHGVSELLGCFDTQSVTEVVDITRPSQIPKSKA